MSYSLQADEVRRRCRTALAGHPSEARFVAMAIGADHAMADVARNLERQVFEQSFGNDADVMATEYSPYEDDSLFMVVVDRKDEIAAGAARVIDGGGKTLDDAPRCIGRDLSEIVTFHELDKGKTWDFATLAVHPAYRGGRKGLPVISLLYRTFLTAGRLADVRHLVCLLDDRAHRNLQHLGARFTSMANSGPFEYLGSSSTRAFYVQFDHLIPQAARHAQNLYTAITPAAGDLRKIAAKVAYQISSGEGLDEHIVLPSSTEWRTERRRANIPSVPVMRPPGSSNECGITRAL